MIAAGPDIPRFGNELHAGQDRVLAARVEEAAALVEAVILTRQDRGQVETEAIHVHLGDPVAQAVGDHLQNPRVADIDRVAGSGIVDVAAAVIRQQAVVAEVVDAAERERGATVVAFRSVIVNDVQDHLEPGVMEARHHLLEFGKREVRTVGEAGVGREEPDGVVAPVIRQALVQQPFVIDEGLHRQQLD